MELTQKTRLEEFVKILERIEKIMKEPNPKDVPEMYAESYKLGRIQGTMLGWQRFK